MSLEDSVKSKYDEAKGKVKEKVGEHTGDESLEGEGHIDQAKGKGREAWGEVKDAAGNAKDAITGH